MGTGDDFKIIFFKLYIHLRMLRTYVICINISNTANLKFSRRKGQLGDVIFE